MSRNNLFASSRPHSARSIFAISLSTIAILAAALTFASVPSRAQQPSAPVDPSLYSAMRWRLIGPYRAGRVSAVAGIPGNPAVYYMGTPGGGVWKTTDGGRVWKPIFDEERVASIGAVAVAPSNPDIVYVGTGEQTEGNGMYKSADAGATWTHIGLEDTKYISAVIIDPRDPNIVVVGVLGHPILGTAAAAKTRGVYKTTDGGKTWTKTLYKDDMAGISDMVADPNNPRVLYAGMWRPRDFRAPPEAGKEKEQTAWIYKSTDEGSTWKQLSGTGFPADPLERVGLAVAPGDGGRRVFVIAGPGLFRSDDAGETWRKITPDPRITGNSYICHVYVDPRNPDVVYVMQTTTYRSTDGGQTFVAYKGAPGGDDYHVLWIDPQNSDRMFLGVDQGGTISVDGGKTWSTWYNQPTGQFYHVITDNQFPYVAYAPQQDSGTVAVPSRSDFGEISYRDWFSIGGFEFCYIAPDPLNPNIVYSGGWYGTVVRFDKVTGQITHVFIRGSKYRAAQMPPLVFSPQDPHTLYLGTQYAMKTQNAGDSWQVISPDLTDRSAEAGAERKPGERVASPRTAITSITPSTLQPGVLWAGTSNGIVQLTQDGGQTWKNVSPPDFTATTSVTILEASHHDVNTAYVAAGIRNDSAPYVYRTRDAGKTWQKITDGLQPGWGARVIREDPVRKGLLYAGTENAVYVSFDDGDHWQSLQLNFPVSDVRDLAVHGNDLVAATYGRALWILDDLSPLRQAGADVAASNAYLLRPATAVRVRFDNDQETPLPPETPAGKNPPDGAIFYYYLKSPPAGELTIEIRDAKKNVVRRFTSLAPPEDKTPKNVPDYWFGPQPVLSKNVSLNRFVWDLHYDPPSALNYSYFGNILDYVEYTLSDHAIPEDTPREQALGPLATPGQYEVTFIGNNVLMKQALTITLDPRVHVSQAELDQQLDASKKVTSGLKASSDAYNAAAALRVAIADRQKALVANASAKDAADAVTDLDKKIADVQEGNPVTPGVGPVNRDLARILYMIQVGDAAPSDSARAAIEESCQTLDKNLADWRKLNGESLPSVNALLGKYNLQPLPVAPGANAPPAAADPPACKD
jgi:photosystem II stability/assembly factor-like uncharacterized protein